MLLPERCLRCHARPILTCLGERAQFAGTFSAPPASIEDMYVSSIRGHTGSDVLRVAPSKRCAGDVSQSEW